MYYRVVKRAVSPLDLRCVGAGHLLREGRGRLRSYAAEARSWPEAGFRRSIYTYTYYGYVNAHIIHTHFMFDVLL